MNTTTKLVVDLADYTQQFYDAKIKIDQVFNNLETMMNTYENRLKALGLWKDKGTD